MPLRGCRTSRDGECFKAFNDTNSPLCTGASGSAATGLDPKEPLFPLTAICRAKPLTVTRERAPQAL